MNLDREYSPEGYPTGMSLLVRSGGRRCFADRQSVVKVIPAGKNEEAAKKTQQLLEGEYGMLRDYLGNQALESSFSIAPRSDQKGWVARIEQTFLTAVTFRWGEGWNITPDTTDFLRNSLRLYKERGVTPDVFADIMPDPTRGWVMDGAYAHFLYPNLYVSMQQHQHNLFLVDTVLSTPLRNRISRPVVSFLIAKRMESMLAKIETGKM